MTATQVFDGAAPQLRERRTELRAVEVAPAEARSGDGQLLLLSGVAGVGKTALLRAATATATAAGFLVLGARGGELEQSFPFGVVGQLFAPIVHDAKRAGERGRPAGGRCPARGAGPVARPRLTPAGRGLRAAQRPLLAVREPVRALAGAARRRRRALGRRGVAAVSLFPCPSRRWHVARAGGRRAHRRTRSRKPIRLAELGVEDRARWIEPSLLSEAAVSGLVRERLWEGASDELCRACHESTRGNAFLVEQVIVGLRQSGKPLMEIAVSDIDGVAAEGISAGVMARIAPLGAKAGCAGRGHRGTRDPGRAQARRRAREARA